MESKQKLLDSLTAHISLYHSQNPARNPNTNQNQNQRSAVLRWFSSLSVHQRRSHLTTINPNFISILLQMNEKLQINGSGRFIILPDLPQNDNYALPTLCYRKCDGLLSRFAEINRAERCIYECVELFSYREGGGNEASGNYAYSSCCLDSMTVGEGLVEDVSRFVGVMDEITNGEFLRGEEEREIASEWPEFGWLKDKGYYSLGEFVANRLEVALRLAWLNCGGGRKRGVKLKERLSAAGLAANLFWRKKGCVDWWEKLDGSMRKKLFVAYLGKAAKLLTADILKGKDNITDGKLWRSEYQGERALGCSSTSLGRRHFDKCNGSYSKAKLTATCPQIHRDSSPLDCMLNSLYILQVICTMLLASQHGGYDKDKLFFSSLDFVNSISDIILRKMRELLMVISLDCTKFELLGDGKTNSIPRKSIEKPAADKRKKKGKNRNKKSYPVPRPCNDDPKPDKHTKGKGDELLYSGNQEARIPSYLDNEVLEKDLAQEGLSTDVMGAVEGADKVFLRSAPKKGRKERKKLKSSSSNSPEVGSCQPRSIKSFSKDGSAMSDRNSGSSTLENMSNGVVVEINKTKTDPNVCSNTIMHTVAQLADSDCSTKISNARLKHHQNSCNPVQKRAANTRDDSLNCNLGSVATTIEPVVGYNDNMSTGSCADSNRIRSKASYLGKQTKGDIQEGKPDPVQERGSLGVLRVGAISSPAYISYEWPNVAPHHPSVNTHLPAATDRLHLDVGHNWQNHFHHSFVQTLQVRKSAIDNAYNGMISRPLPMSLDWPPTVRGVNGLVPSITCNYDWEFISRRQSSLQQVTAQYVTCGAASSEDERTTSGDLMDFADVTYSQEVVEDQEKFWMSEEESEAHGVSEMDYSQYFGGGVMYWDPSDLPGTSFSRPPSLCSDDSSWAWREADMNRAVDDMVAFSSSYSTNGLTSPSAASFCSPFDPLGSGALGYVMPGSEVSGKVLHSPATITDVVAEESVSGSMSNISGDGEMKTVDSLPYPILRPIIIPSMSRERSRSDFKRSYDHKSPCVPPNRREQPRIKRPPSPVVLCVPRAPRPPPPSPAGDSRRHRGFSTVRSGSSSPRHWGVKGWLHDGVNLEEAYIPMDGSEVVWPSWRSKGLSARQLTQPLAGAMLQDRLLAISQLARDQEHPDITFPLQPPESQNSSSRKAHLSVIHDILHEDIDTFGKQVAAENLIRKPYINWAVKRVARSLQVLWPRSRTNVFGSNATGLSLPSSDVDLVVCLPPVRNLEPIKEAGILEGRNGIKETCLQHAARYLANQEWVKSDSLKIVENTAIPIIMLVVEVPHDLISSAMLNVQMPKEEADQVAAEEGNLFHTDAASSESSISPKWSRITNDTADGVKTVRLDISFKSPTHTGLQTTGLVKDLTERFPAVTPLALVLKQFLADRTLDQSYSGGLSSYCLILLITRFLQHEHHHSRSINQNYGSLLMDFLYFFGNVFDPRQMRISVQGSGVYLKRERGCSIDPLYIDDPLFVTNNVGRNCFRIHQCIKAFADAYVMLENELTCLPNDDETDYKPTCRLLPKIIPSLGHLLRMEGVIMKALSRARNCTSTDT